MTTKSAIKKEELVEEFLDTNTTLSDFCKYQLTLYSKTRGSGHTKALKSLMKWTEEDWEAYEDCCSLEIFARRPDTQAWRYIHPAYSVEGHEHYYLSREQMADALSLRETKYITYELYYLLRMTSDAVHKFKIEMGKSHPV
jgi:hypothetical protein